MKIKHLCATSLIASLMNAHGITLLFEDFEDDLIDYAITSPDNSSVNSEDVTDVGNSDYYGIVDYSNTIPAAFTNSVGDSYFGVQDTDGANSPVAEFVLTWDDIDISGHSSLLFSGFFGEDMSNLVENWDPDTSFNVAIDINNSGSFTTIFAIEAEDAFVNNTRPRIDTDFDGVGDGAEITDTLTQHSAAISGTGSTLDLRITLTEFTGGNEDIAFDNITIEGTPIPEPSSTLLLGLGSLSLLARRKRST